MAKEVNLREDVGQALMTFQFLEEAIRDYLDITMKIIKEKVEDPNITFSLYDEKDTLGTLARKFTKACDNPSLVTLLNELPEERNKLAHQIWLNYRKETESLLYRERDDDIGKKLEKCVSDKIEEVAKIEEKAHTCFLLLIIEIKRIKKLLK